MISINNRKKKDNANNARYINLKMFIIVLYAIDAFTKWIIIAIF